MSESGRERAAAVAADGDQRQAFGGCRVAGWKDVRRGEVEQSLG